MNSEQIDWSEEKQKNLQSQLVGFYAQDIWQLKRKYDGGIQYFRFECLSASVNVELKYALWCKFDRGEWDITTGQGVNCKYFHDLVKWLNQCFPNISSLLQNSLEKWEIALRSYLVQTDQYTRRSTKRLNAQQEYVRSTYEDGRIMLFRQIYHLVEEAYDDRDEMEKDKWSVSRLGLPTYQSRPRETLNFTLITQPWLRLLAKEFIKYNLARYTVVDCVHKINSLNIFSQFLERHFPTVQLRNIDRSVVVCYLTYLREQDYSDVRRNRLLTHLRTILNTCAYLLHMEGLTKEAIIFDEDLVKEKLIHPRELPEEVLTQVKEHLEALPTTTLRMVVVNLSCGLRIGELCSLSLHCIFQDNQGRWYLQLYQSKGKKEHVFPLVDEVVVGTIQAQQEEIKQRWGNTCSFLFPSSRSPKKPFQQATFALQLNRWAVTHNICGKDGKVYRFQSHQFRHTAAMGWLNDGVPLDVIRRLLNHSSIKMTERYARRRDEEVRAELEKVHRMRKTVDYQGKVVIGDPRANDPDVQMIRKGIRGQTLPVGGCGRLVVRGPCEHANKCLTCPFWLTSTDDLPALKSFYARAVRLKQRAVETGHQLVIEQQEHLIPLLAIRIKSLEVPPMDGSLSVHDLLLQLRADLAEAESGLEEACEAGLVLAAKALEWMITELKARIAALEEKA